MARASFFQWARRNHSVGPEAVGVVVLVQDHGQHRLGLGLVGSKSITKSGINRGIQKLIYRAARLTPQTSARVSDPLSENS